MCIWTCDNGFFALGSPWQSNIPINREILDDDAVPIKRSKGVAIILQYIESFVLELRPQADETYQ